MKPITPVLFLATFLTAQAAPQVEITAEPHHHLTFTNAQVRAFNINIPPHAETLMHWHRHDCIYVTLGDSEMVNAVQGKDVVTVKLRDGQTGFFPGAFDDRRIGRQRVPCAVEKNKASTDQKRHQLSMDTDFAHQLSARNRLQTGISIFRMTGRKLNAVGTNKE